MANQNQIALARAGYFIFQELFNDLDPLLQEQRDLAMTNQPLDASLGRFGTTLERIESAAMLASMPGHRADRHMWGKLDGSTDVELITEEMHLKKGLEALGIDYRDFVVAQVHSYALTAFADVRSGKPKTGELGTDKKRARIDKRLAIVDQVTPGLRKEIESQGFGGTINMIAALDNASNSRELAERREAKRQQPAL